MKTLYILAFALISLAGISQTTTAKKEDEDLNCYNKWAQKFSERGAEEVADGTYDDVIVSIRKGATAECFNGRAIVKEKKVISVFILREDNTYQELKWDWKENSKIVTIDNGMSTAFVYKDNKTLVNVIWPKKMKAKKAPFKKAPDPVDD